MGLLTIRLIVSGLIGAGVALPIYMLGHHQIALGIGVSIAAVGFFFTLSSLMVDRPAVEGIEGFLRLLGGILRLLAVAIVIRNIPGLNSSKMMGWDKPPMPEERKIQTADPGLLWNRLLLGILAGMIVLAICVAVVAWNSSDGVMRPRGSGFALVALLSVLIGGIFLGGGLGILTLSGVHRRNILAGLFGGLMFGAGVAICLAKYKTEGDFWSPFHFWCPVSMLVGGMIGMLLLDNVRFVPSEDADYVDEADAM